MRENLKGYRRKKPASLLRASRRRNQEALCQNALGLGVHFPDRLRKKDTIMFRRSVSPWNVHALPRWRGFDGFRVDAACQCPTTKLSDGNDAIADAILGSVRRPQLMHHRRG